MYTSRLSLLLVSALCSTALAQSNGPHDRVLTTVDIDITPKTSRSMRVRSDPVTQRLSYFEANGLAIIHGDVIYSSVDEVKNAKNHKRAFSRFKTESTLLWTGGKIDYKWASDDAKGLGRLEAWTEATKRWTNMLPWLKFVEHPVSANLVQNILTLTPTVAQYACFSPIGKASSANASQMILDDQCGGAGTYTHELGHTLGLRHEHQRPDRDNYIAVNCTNVWQSPPGTPADCSQNNCKGYGCNFVKLAPSAADYSGPYDSLSLMHYAPYEFASGGPAIVAKPGVPQPIPHSYPTALDAKRVCDLLSSVPCPGVCGDGKIDTANGEECDDGNNLNGDGCSASCKKEGSARPSSSSLGPSKPSSTYSAPSKPSSTPAAPSKPSSTPAALSKPSSTPSALSKPSSTPSVPNRPLIILA